MWSSSGPTAARWRGVASGRPRSDSLSVERNPGGRSASPRCSDSGNVDPLHRHHRLEGTLCLAATSRKRLGEHARRDLPREAPAILAPTALAFLATIADDGVPIAVRLFLSVRRDLEGKGLAVPELRAAASHLFGTKSVIRIVDHDRRELPPSVCLLQQGNDASTLQFLSVGLAAYGDAPGDCGGGAQ